MATRETPFSMDYGVEAMIPAKVKVPSLRNKNFDEETNTALLAADHAQIVQ